MKPCKTKEAKEKRESNSSSDNETEKVVYEDESDTEQNEELTEGNQSNGIYSNKIVSGDFWSSSVQTNNVLYYVALVVNVGTEKLNVSYLRRNNNNVMEDIFMKLPTLTFI